MILLKFPVLLWKISDRLFAESKLEIEQEGIEDTTLSLETAQLSYLLNVFFMAADGRMMAIEPESTSIVT